MNHVFVREPGVVGDNPGHSKSRGGTAHGQVATNPVRQCKEVRRIVRALTSTGCHIERIGRLDEKIHARVVRPRHISVPNSLRWQAGQAHQLALGPIGTLDLVTVSGDARALNELSRGYTRRCTARRGGARPPPRSSPGRAPLGELTFAHLTAAILRSLRPRSAGIAVADVDAAQGERPLDVGQVPHPKTAISSPTRWVAPAMRRPSRAGSSRPSRNAALPWKTTRRCGGSLCTAAVTPARPSC